MPPGFKRSRAIWDETKHGGMRAWVNAICYELQPIRLSKSTREEAVATLVSIVKTISSLILAIPSICKSFLMFLSRRTLKQWAIIGAVLVYYWFVRFIHEALDAGPIVLILTALTLIFSIGLSDEENREGLSAYSVFNRGFEQLLGSVDADSLLAQHVGGGFMMNMDQRNEDPDRNRNRNRENVERPNRNIQGDDNNDGAVANEDEAGNDDIPRQNNNNRARKSGKKARRRNLDQRRDLRRQREAAMQMNLDGGGAEDAVEVQRAIEEQIALENNQ